jgi:probable HAF family extracellular repeat protein
MPAKGVPVKKQLLLSALMMVLMPFVAAQEYTVRSLAGLGKERIPNAINSNGDVVGYFYLDNRNFHAFLWTNSGGMQDLGTLGGDISGANGINDRGDVAGTAQTGTRMGAFLWTKSGGMKDLGTLAGGDAFGEAINQQGDIVGGSGNAVFWPYGGNIVDLGISGSALAVNRADQVVGLWYKGGNGAFLWTPEQGVQDIGTLGGFSEAWGINDSGQIVGRSALSSGGSYHAFLWTQGTGMQDLGTLGGDSSQARGINANSYIVGSASVQPGDAGSAFVWTPTLGMKDLNTLIAAKPVWRLTTAAAINGAGQISVRAYQGTSKKSSAVLLTPVMATTLASSQNPVKAGQSVTFTATTGNLIQGPPPDGEIVTFKDAWRVLAQVPLSGGVASFTTSTLNARTHSIRAYYSGDANYQSSKSAILQQVVEP